MPTSSEPSQPDMQSHSDVVTAGLSQTDQNIDNTVEDLKHAARGHKANLSNPNTSEKSKKQSEKALTDLGEEMAKK